MRLPLSALLLLTLAACGDDGLDVCAARHETYHVSATLSVREPGKSAGEGSADAASSSAPEGKLLVAVQQDREIQTCKDGLVTEATPASSLLSVDLDMYGGSIAFDVPSTIYPAVFVPSLWLDLRLDENGNGRCDDGEPAGGVELSRNENVSVHIELVRAACALPKL